ncbi:MAG: HYR domain-containing protein [Flavipsychrobacter sp.]|nr:HYR domain-containing protein [Flavipsychrobacter sp.]
MKRINYYLRFLLMMSFGLAVNNTTQAQCTTPVISSVANTGPACVGNSISLTAVGTVGGTSTNFVRVAGIGGNAGNQEFNELFSSGDRPGSITRISNATFDAIFASASTNAARAALLKAQYDVLMFTWASPYDANITWGLLEAYLATGGSIFWDGDYANIGNLYPNIVGTQNDGSAGCSYILVNPAPFPTLVANGINGCFTNHHLSVTSWPSWMHAYIMANSSTTVAIAGVYPGGNHGRLIIQGPDQDYHACRCASTAPWGGGTAGNQYQIMLNQMDFLAANGGSFTWTGPNGFTATGGNPILTNVTTDMSGTYTATLTNITGGGCSASASTTVVVNSAPTISGTNTLCGGGTVSLSASIAGGTWSSSNTAVATVDPSTGVVTAVAGGTATISYSLGCTATYAITVTGPTAITGAGTVVPGYTTALGNATSGGVWTSSNTSIATVSSTGVVTGVAIGNATITYSIGSCYVTKPMAVAITYCTPAYSSASYACSSYDMYINNFSVTGASGSNLVDNGSGCNGSGYQDRRSVVTPVNFVQGNSYSASITVGSYYQQNVQAWIDFNNNGTFESSEAVGGVSYFVNTNSFSLTIPSGAALGSHTMRVRCGYYYYATPYPNMNPCSDYYYGEAQDYTVNILSACTAPSISCAGAVSADAATGACSANVSFDAATTTGTSPTVTYSHASGSSFSVGVTTVTATATNGCGTASCSFTVTVNDNQNPTITAPANVTVNANSGACNATGYDLGTATTADNCGVASVTNDDAGTYAVGTHNIIWTVTDVHGNTATATQTITVVDNQNPTITAPANVTVNANSGACNATGYDLGTATTADNCGVASVTSDDAGTYAVGTHNITWTVTDVNGNTATATQTITVVDNQNPVASCQNYTLSLSGGSGSITASNVDNGSSDNCGIASMSVSPSTFTCANAGANTVTLTVTDVNGNVSTCNATVTVQYQPSASISVTPANTTYTGGVANNIYLGYGPQSATLTANGTGGSGFTYSWTPGTRLSCTTCQSPVFTPTAAGTYVYTVTVTNSNGCSTTATVSMCVIDARDASNSNKVILCHVPPGNPSNPQTLSIASSAVPSHLTNHAGDRLGSCASSCGTSAKEGMPIAAEVVNENNFSMLVYPNPTTSDINVDIESEISNVADIVIFDITGRVVEMQKAQSTNTSIKAGRDLPAGVYILEVRQNEISRKVKITKL